MSVMKYFAYLAVLIVAIIAVYFIFGQQKSEPFPYEPPYPVPQGTLHWHPNLKILIKGEERYIPDNVGVNIGNVIDTNIGMEAGMSPIHTHEGQSEYSSQKGRKLHMENAYPKKKFEALTVGYFFKVWGKKFNSTCIIDKCNGPEGTLKMYVNGKENFDYEHYFMQDNDEILIKFE